LASVVWRAPGNLEAFACRIRLCYQPDLLIVVAFFELFRRNISAGGVKPIAVIPGDPLHGSDGDIANATPRPFPIDELSLVQRINRPPRSRVVTTALDAY